jgi:hypothetical protein
MKMEKIGVLLAVLLVVCISCKKNEEKPQYQGEIVLSSELLQSGQDYIFYGFSFETGKISTYSLTGGALPDLAAIHVIMGETITVDLSSSNDKDAFYKNGNFSSAAEAQAYYDSYSEVIASEFQPLALNIRENQVWTVKTAAKKYAKIWIKELTIQTGALSDFANVRIQYNYQPDGSKTF